MVMERKRKSVRKWERGKINLRNKRTACSRMVACSKGSSAGMQFACCMIATKKMVVKRQLRQKSR